MERIVDIALVLGASLLALAGFPALLPNAGAVSAFLCAVIMAATFELARAPWRGIIPLAFCGIALVLPSAVAFLPLAAYELARCVHDAPVWRIAGLAAPIALAARIILLSNTENATTDVGTFTSIIVLMAFAMLVSVRTNRLEAQRTLSHRIRDDLQKRALTLREQNDALSEQVGQLSASPDPRQTEPAARPAAFACLTEREYEVARLVADGLDNHEIAALAYISEGTVRNRISTILAKMGLQNRTQIAVAWWRGR